MSKLSECLSNCIRSVEEVKEIFHLSEEEVTELRQITERYPICITPYYLSLVDPEDKNDPIRKMCFPSLTEYAPGGEEDTSGEADNTVLKGMQHKYAQTALILSTNQCAMYCRHCFRKRMVGYSADEVANALPAMAEYVRRHTEINNVLISGGDAFINPNPVIQKYLDTFTAIGSLDFIRFGTRVPVVLPERITGDEELLSMLKSASEKKQILIVTQFNHPKEITPASTLAIRKLRECGCVIRNQTVLLRGVNDNKEVLGGLMNGMVKIGVIPYYIFQCRPVAGVKNQFQVPLREGQRLVEQAKSLMSGQAKSVRYVMSHPTGKIEIVGPDKEGKMIFKYHQAKYAEDNGRIFVKRLKETDCWLGEKVDADEG